MIRREVEVKSSSWAEVDSNLQFMDTRPVLSAWGLTAPTIIQILLSEEGTDYIQH